MSRATLWRRSAALILLSGAVAACQAPDTTEPPAGPTAGSVTSPADPASRGGDTSSADADGSSPVAVDTVYHAGVSGLTEERTAVIRTGEAWQALWAEMVSIVSPVPEAPAVDFSESQLVVAALGTRPSGGYDVELAGVTSVGGSVAVALREVAPGAGCMTTQALTSPVLVIALPRLEGDVEFTAERVARDCS